MIPIPVSPIVGIGISTVMMALTIVFAARVVLKREPTPWGHALLMAAVANLLGKLFVSVLYWPPAISYALPTLSFFSLSYAFFRPTWSKMLVYWLVGFAAYLVLHLALSAAFGWTFMFPWWTVAATSVS